MSSVPLSSPDTRVAYFDRLAPRYDEVWTNSAVGRLQRDAVWRHLDPLVRRGDRILDIGCGTGEDALHFAGLGGEVLALDVSPEMVRIARSRGVNARVLPMEGIHVFADAFELVLSNFGGLNCLRDLSTLCETLARLVRPQGFLAICLMSRFCLWESAYYAVRGQFKKAARRWRGAAMTSARSQPCLSFLEASSPCPVAGFRSGCRCRRRNPGSAILRGADVPEAAPPNGLGGCTHRNIENRPDDR